MVHIGIYVYATQLIFDFYFGFTRKTESYANNSLPLMSLPFIIKTLPYEIHVAPICKHMIFYCCLIAQIEFDWELQMYKIYQIVGPQFRTRKKKPSQSMIP